MFTLNGSTVKVACVMIREWDKGSYQSVECALINEKFETLHVSIEKFNGYGNQWSVELAKVLCNHPDVKTGTNKIDYLYRFMDDNKVQVIENKCYVPRLKDL